MADIQSESPANIQLDEHNDDAHAKRVVIRGQDVLTGSWYNVAVVDGGDGQFALNTRDTYKSYNLRIDATTTTSVTYVGRARPGTQTDDALWQIQKIDETGANPIITWADGTAAFTKTWDNRTSYVYTD